MIIPALKKTYSGKVVLDTPEIEIPEGSILAVCGHNGSGKSTFARILAGVIRDDDGKAKMQGVRIGYMPQRPLAFRLSVRNNLLINADRSFSEKEKEEQSRLSRDPARRAEQLLSAVGLSDVERKRGDRLSGGQIQRMSLARTLMKEYELLILDEPTASMDQQMIPQAEQLIRGYQEQTGCTIVIITHSPEQAARFSDIMIVLEEGKILPSGC